MALLLAVCMFLALPGISFAHAILIRSDPTQGAVLRIPPKQVRLWFSEAIDPQLSTAQVVTPTDQQAGPQQARMPSAESSEIVVTLSSRLVPGIYVVMYRTVSTDDGHIESGSFSFTVTLPNGTLPPHPHTPTGTPTTTASSTVSLLDPSTLISFIMLTLIEVGAICWVGAALFQLFVVEPVMQEHATHRRLSQQVREHLLDRVLPLTMAVLLLAHGGVLIGQGLALTQGKNAAVLTPAILKNLVLNGHFGLWWLVRMLVLVLMSFLLVSRRLFRQRSDASSRLLAWVSLFFGLILLIALAMSSHAAALASQKVTMAVLGDFLHLFAASLWVGGMLIIALSYLPVLSRSSLAERASSLVTVLPYYSLWALAGVLVMAITGPLSATFQLTSWKQLLTTAYGNVLLVKVLLVTGMLVLSAFHVLVLRPRVRVASQKYHHATTRLETVQLSAEAEQARTRLVRQVKQREARLTRPTRQLLTVLRLEPLLGVAVLLCVGLMNVLGGTLVPVTAASSIPRTTVQMAQSHPLTLETFDRRFQVLFTMTPQQVGINRFQVRIVDGHTGKALSTVKVQLNTELQERAMGVAVVPMQAQGDGQFSGSTDLAVSGTWRIIVQIQTPDDPYHFHEAYTDVDLPS